MKYNNHEKLKSSKAGGVTIMIKGRKTSFDERVEIVKYYIEYSQNYSETAQKFNVSYQQVYSWTNKYLKDGIKALEDRRGRKKSEAENPRKQMDIDFLKKLEEVERGVFKSSKIRKYLSDNTEAS